MCSTVMCQLFDPSPCNILHISRSSPGWQLIAGMNQCVLENVSYHWDQYPTAYWRYRRELSIPSLTTKPHHSSTKRSVLLSCALWIYSSAFFINYDLSIGAWCIHCMCTCMCAKRKAAKGIPQFLGSFFLSSVHFLFRLSVWNKVSTNYTDVHNRI